MPLPEPKFDSRTYKELLNEALARIPAHNPEWRNLSDSDPGVTLLQLFAFMSESIIYRANLIPERNRMKFLRLLGLSMRPAEPARGIVTFNNPKGRLNVETLDKDEEVLAGKVPFRTENGLNVLPIEARLYYKSPVAPESAVMKKDIEEIYSRLYASYGSEPVQPVYYETKVFSPPASGVTLTSIDLGATSDNSLWIALLSRSGEKPEDAKRIIAGSILNLGIVPAMDESGRSLYPAGQSPSEERPKLVFETPNIEDKRIRYRQLRSRSSDDLLSTPGIAEVELPPERDMGYWTAGPLEAGTGDRPPSIEETDDLDRLITWIRIRPSQSAAGKAADGGRVSIPLSWAGINAARVVQRTRVSAEMLSQGTGEPDQVVQLINTPVLQGSLELIINGEKWRVTDDLSTAPPEVPAQSPRFSSVALESAARKEEDSKVFAIDWESGEIRFGDGAHGMRPPGGATIQASYSYGGGREGVVGIGSIKKGPRLPEGIKVINPVPTWGGSEGESVEEAEKNIPKFIRHRDRLVSEEDFKDIVNRTPGVELGRVEILPLFHPRLKRQLSQGVVTVMVIPESDPEQPKAPRPGRMFLETVCAYLAPRRILTTEVHIRGPEYKDIWICAGIDVVQGYDAATVIENVQNEIERFLSPLEGGFEGKGWLLNKTVDAREILAAAARVAGVAKVNQLRLAESGGSDVSEVSMEGLELPHLKNVVAAFGDAPEIDDIRATAPEEEAPGKDGRNLIPVPVIPGEC